MSPSQAQVEQVFLQLGLDSSVVMHNIHLGCSMSPPWDLKVKGNQHEREAHAACCALSSKSCVSDPRISASNHKTEAG